MNIFPSQFLYLVRVVFLPIVPVIQKNGVCGKYFPRKSKASVAAERRHYQARIEAALGSAARHRVPDGRASLIAQRRRDAPVPDPLVLPQYSTSTCQSLSQRLTNPSWKTRYFMKNRLWKLKKKTLRIPKTALFNSILKRFLLHNEIFYTICNLKSSF